MGEIFCSIKCERSKTGKSEFFPSSKSVFSKKIVFDVIGKFLNFLLFGNMHGKLPTCFFYQFFLQEEPSPELEGPSARGGNEENLSPSDATIGPKPSAGSRHNQREEPSPTMGFLHPKEEASEKEVL